MMQFDLMGRAFLMAPDGNEGGSASGLPVDYGTSSASAPETETTTEQTDSQVVDNGGATVAKDAEEQPSQTPAWMAQLPKDMRDDSELAKFRTIGDLVKHYKAEAEKGAQKDAATEDVQKVDKGTEAESAPVKYENFAGKLSDSNDPYGNITQGLVEQMEGMGIPQKQAETLLKSLDEAQTKGLDQMVQAGVKYTESAVKKMWGKDYDSNRAYMARGYMAVDPKGELQKSLDKEGASLSPSVWELLSRVGRMVSEDKAVGSQVGKAQEAKDPNCPVTYKY